MRIHVNGESRNAESGTTVSDLLRQLEVRADRVAVELNLEILDRQDFDRRPLSDGDRVEILSFIGGGASRVRGGTSCARPREAGTRRHRARRRVPAETGDCSSARGGSHET